MLEIDVRLRAKTLAYTLVCCYYYVISTLTVRSGLEFSVGHHRATVQIHLPVLLEGSWTQH